MAKRNREKGGTRATPGSRVDKDPDSYRAACGHLVTFGSPHELCMGCAMNEEKRAEELLELEAQIIVIRRKCADESGLPGYPALNKRRKALFAELAKYRDLTDRELLYVV